LKRFAEWVINYKNQIKSSLTIKTFFILLILFIIICLAIYIFVSLLLPYANEDQSRRQLDDKSKLLVSKLRQLPAAESSTLFMNFIQETGADLSLMNHRREAIDLFTFSAVNNTNTLSGQEYPFRFAGSDEEYILSVRFNPVRSKETSDAIWRSLPWTISVILILSFTSAFIFSQYTTGPIVRMSKTARRIADLDFSWYCPDLRSDEIGILARSLNDLSDKLNAALLELHHRNLSLEDEILQEKKQERRRLLFFSGVSHELKTPIAIVIGQLEGMQAQIGVYKNRDKYLARSAEILRSLDRFIKEILYISHMDITGKNIIEQINLSTVLESLLRDFQALMDSHEIKLSTEIEPFVFISGDEALLKKALGNIVSNAASYSSIGGEIHVILMVNKNEAKLEIINTPSHIDDEHLPHLFEAFYRADKNTQGSGLGLYITRMILNTHGIAHDIENCKYGVKFTAIFKALQTPHKKHISSSQTPHDIL